MLFLTTAILGDFPQATRCLAGWCRCAAPTACWCCRPRRSSTWSCTRARSSTSWSSAAYDAGLCRRQTHSPRLHIMHIRLMPHSPPPSTDCSVTRYGSPWQCQDFLSGQETGGGRKRCMSTWSPLAVMSYANSQSEPVEADSSLVHSEETTVFQKKDLKKKKKKRRCEKKKNVRFIL